MEIWDAPFTVIAFLWWPFVIYSGWVTVASIVNVAAYLVKINWDGFGVSAVTWTLIMIGIATLINLVITWKRNMREFAFVGIWALFAIYKRHTGSIDAIANMALAGSIILAVVVIINLIQNRKTNPFLTSNEKV